MICSDIYNCCSYNGCAQDGQDLFSSDLLTLIHFGSNISGGNGQAMAACSGPSMAIAMGGQGGAGLYIIARCVVFTGEIILNGGNGMAVVGSCNPSYNCSSAGGGGGSCIIRTSQLSQNTGMFSSVGGNSGVCNKKGGNGAMLIVTD